MPMDIDAVQQYSSSTWWIKNPAQKHGRILLVLPRWNRHVKTWHICPRIFHGFHVSDIQKLRFLTEIRALFGTWALVHQPGAKLHRGHAHHPCQVDFHVGPGPPGLKLGETTTGNLVVSIQLCQVLPTVGVWNPNVSYENDLGRCPRWHIWIKSSKKWPLFISKRWMHSLIQTKLVLGWVPKHITNKKMC